MIIFWRGVWHTADYFSYLIFGFRGEGSIDAAELWDGLLSMAIGAVLLLVTGLFVSSFIGNEILISGMRGEKKIAEKTEEEIEEEEEELSVMERDVREIKKLVGELSAQKRRK